VTLGPGRAPAGAGWAGAGWAGALLRGFLVFLLVAGIGVGAALLVYTFVDPGFTFGGALRLGALYLGPFHHVAIVVTGHLDVAALRLQGSDLPSQGSVTLEVGVALLAVTALAGWLLFRAGRASARGVRGGPVARSLAGARVALGYAPPFVLVALLVSFEEPVRLGSFVAGDVRVSLDTGQAVVIPLALAGLAGGAGGLRSWVGAHRVEPRVRRAAAVIAGGWTMFVLGVWLAYLGLFAAGVVQPDEPVALVTPSTARYARAVSEHPGRGAVILGHHLALSPNEALWTLVPSTGACDVVRGTESADVLCFGAFPTDVPVFGAGSSRAFETAPVGYVLFLLVPAVATLVGGRRAASRAGLRGRGEALAGALAGVVFAAFVAAGALLASVTLSYAASAGTQTGEASLWFGPDPVRGTLLALGWGVVGGALGAASGGLRSTRAAGSRSG
jgi:hypothetical protein